MNSGKHGENLNSLGKTPDIWSLPASSTRAQAQVTPEGRRIRSLGELADIVRGFIPDAKITFTNEGGREESGNYLVDWSRLAKEFGLEYPGLYTRVLEVLNEVRQQEGLPPVGTR